jgi:hypothetical protein
VACQACGVGTYKTASGVGTCDSCPAHSTTSEEGSALVTSCVCTAGYTADSDGVECAACVAGTFKEATGSGTCETCPADTNSAEGSTEATSCVCDTGFTADSDGGGCTACQAGTYKSETGGEASTSSVCGSFAVHARDAVNFNGGQTIIHGGDVGVSPGTSITGDFVFAGAGVVADDSGAFAASVVAAHSAAMEVRNPKPLTRNPQPQTLNSTP